MRQKTRSSVQSVRSSTKEPLAEGLQILVPTDSCGRRLWRKISDDEIVEIAKGVMKEQGITGKEELQKTDVGLYFILRRRKLEEKVGFETKIRKRRSWKDMSNEEIIKLARKVIEEKGITGRKELQNADCGLYEILRKRGLISEVGFEEKIKEGRSWADMDNEKIVELARMVMREKKISGKGELEEADPGIYTVLRKRGLLDKVGFEEKVRSWIGMSDEGIIELIRKVMLEKGISGRHELEHTDRGLYNISKKRGLLDDVEFAQKRRKGRSWKDMSNDEIVEFAKKIMEEKGITGRNDLDRADSGVYSILKRRKLLDRAFAHIDRQQTDNARDAVINALEAFAANDNGSAEDEVA
ncbi:MAG: hypothetical protein ABH983_04250 [Candidatus Micrarchaeota archaeon]